MDKNLGSRLLEFINKNFGSVKEFAELSGLRDSSISRYINNKSMPGTDKLVTFWNLGMSIDWWLTGKGNMFANNSNGLILQRKFIHENGENQVKNSPHQRALNWIFENYENLENFCLIWDCELEEVYNFLYHNFLPNPELIEVIESSGCNKSWLSSGHGDKYANNVAGTILKMRAQGINKHDEEKLKKEIKELYKDDISFISQKELYSILKIAHNIDQDEKN